jgi:Flp pilus assembly protein TadD
MARGDPQPELQQLLSRREFGPALNLANNIVSKHPRDASAWFSLARAAFGLGRLRQADEAVDRTLRLGSTGHEVQLLRAIVDHRLGRSSAAIDRLRMLVSKRAPNATDAVLALACASCMPRFRKRSGVPIWTPSIASFPVDRNGSRRKAPPSETFSPVVVRPLKA